VCQPVRWSEIESKEVVGDVADKRGEKSLVYNWIRGIIEEREMQA
jgi:hypothetical protein